MNDENSAWYGPDTATFGDRVAGARAATGMSRSQLARRLGVKKSTVVGWENDLSEPRANKLSMLAGLLNVSIIWLLTGTGAAGTVAPSETVSLPDISALTTELREIRAVLLAAAERTEQAERRLRGLMQAAE